jgi:hypothetical protein
MIFLLSFKELYLSKVLKEEFIYLPRWIHLQNRFENLIGETLKVVLTIMLIKNK